MVIISDCQKASNSRSILFYEWQCSFLFCLDTIFCCSAWYHFHQRNLKFYQCFVACFRHVDDIDLFIGGVSEDPADGAVVGPSFGCIIARSFQNLRKGDRLWYENKENGFSEGKSDGFTGYTCKFSTISKLHKIMQHALQLLSEPVLGSKSL